MFCIILPYCTVYWNLDEFDFGMSVLAQRVRDSNFPWLLSNLTARNGPPQLCGTREYIVLHGLWHIFGASASILMSTVAMP